MPPTSFEWDDVKAASNEAKHGVSFVEASVAMTDPSLAVFVDKRRDYGEIRKRALGWGYGRLLTMIYTERSGAVRMISARTSSRKERREYMRTRRT